MKPAFASGVRVDGLVVKEAIVGEGPTMKRMMTRARGSGSTIRKRSSHIRIILTDEIEIKTREKKKGGKKSGTRKSTRPKATKSTTESKTAEASQSEISNQQSEI